jgi:GTPase involved in cell partitioning and DNA repair
MLVHSTFISRFIYTPIRRYAAVDPSIVERDIIYLSVRAGHGGNGLQKYNGVGGNGASIYIRPTKNSLFSELCDLFREKKKIIKGKPGTESMQRKLAGASAEPVSFLF